MKDTIIKTITKSAAAVLLGMTILLVLGRIFSPKYINENRDGNITAEFYGEDTPLDAVFFGSSTVYNAISPDVLWDRYGFASYTRANASQTLWQSYYLMRDTVRYNRPKLITLDVSFMKYGADFAEEAANRKTIDGMRFSADKLGCAKASMWEDESLSSYIFPIFRFHSRWDELTEDDLRFAFRRPKVTYEGFIMEFGRTDEPEEFGKLKPGDRLFPEKAEEYLVKIMDYCRDEDIPLLLMKTPTYINTWFPEYDKRLEEMAKGYEGCDYINFDRAAEEIGLDRREDYVDGHSHLNVDGARKFSVCFGRYIKDRYDLPDHRGDDRYSGVWNDRYTRYCMDIEKGKAALK